MTDGGVMPEWHEAPTFCFANPYALVGARDDVAVPPGSELLDFALEVAAVVGRRGGSPIPEQARDAVFGCTVRNDWSARDLQRRELRVGLGPAEGRTSPAPRAHGWSPPTNWSRTGTTRAS